VGLFFHVLPEGIHLGGFHFQKGPDPVFLALGQAKFLAEVVEDMFRVAAVIHPVFHVVVKAKTHDGPAQQ